MTSELLVENRELSTKISGAVFFDVQSITLLVTVNEELEKMGFRPAKYAELLHVSGIYRIQDLLPLDKAIVSTCSEYVGIEPDYTYIPGVYRDRLGKVRFGTIGFIAINDKMIVMAVKKEEGK